MMPLLRSPESFVQTWERCTMPAKRTKVGPLRVDRPTVPRVPIEPWNPAKFPVEAILHPALVIHPPPH